MDIYFAGGKFRAKSKFANIAKISSTRKIRVIQYITFGIMDITLRYIRAERLHSDGLLFAVGRGCLVALITHVDVFSRGFLGWFDFQRLIRCRFALLLEQTHVCKEKLQKCQRNNLDRSVRIRLPVGFTRRNGSFATSRDT